VTDREIDGSLRRGAPGDAYDRLPYTDHAYAESHPDRLAVVAHLSGWDPPGVATARILELGCGRGGNLLPMASALPGAVLVGIDLSRRQIEEAQAIAAAAALGNVRFVAATFEDLSCDAPGGSVETTDGSPPVTLASLGDRAGTYDYVIAHGVASWVPPASRHALLRAMRASLAPGGIAYVSFNVLPGWYERMAAREWLRENAGTQKEGDAHEDARASLAWLRDQVSPEQADYRRGLGAVVRRLGETDRAYAAHEYLSDEHHPQWVSALLREAAEAGLAYLGDAVPSETALELLPDEVRVRARAMGAPAAQPLVDFVRNTAFRRALFVRADTAAALPFQAPLELKVDALEGLRIASRLRPHRPHGALAPGASSPAASSERFDAADVSVQIDDATTRRALHELARVAPRSLGMAEITRLVEARDPAALRRELFDLWLATGALALHAHEPTLAIVTGERPLACPVARWHAAHGGAITNHWHEEVRLEEAPLRRVLALLDGTRTAGELAAAAGGSADMARASIEALAAAALLVG
jgi:SAM-dependent methyltransferase